MLLFIIERPPACSKQEVKERNEKMKKIIIVFLAIILFVACTNDNIKKTDEMSKETSSSTCSNSAEEKGNEAHIYPSADTTYPENQYIMDVEHFVNRDNDEYIDYLFKVLSSTNWIDATGVYYKDYEGFSSCEEFNSQLLLNIFFTAIENNISSYEGNHLYTIIPVKDIYSVLDKYFVGYELDIHETTHKFIYFENETYISCAVYGFYPLFMGGYRIESINDNGDGTVTINIIVNGVEEIDNNYIPNGKDESLHTFIIEPSENSCIIHSYKIIRY